MKISYETLHGVAERIDYCSDSEDGLTVVIKPECNGVMTLGTGKFAISEGISTIPYASLPDGEYVPRLETDTGIYIAEGFTKCGREIHIPRTDEKTIRRLIVRSHALDKKCTQLEEKVRQLELSCLGHNIFKFERKEK